MTYEELKKQWAPENVGELSDYSTGSHKKMKWICSNGHTWESEIRRRYLGDGCPFCSGRLPIRGENDLLTVNPRLAGEWHPTKNGSLLPSDVKPHSDKKVWWKCPRCHGEWQATVNDRSAGKGCPECSRYGAKRVSRDKSLAAMFPNLESEWDYDKNLLSPWEVRPGCNEYCHWVCDKGHRWYSQIRSRTRNYRPNKCPFCSGKRVIPGETDLLTTDPEIASEFDTANRIRPDEVTRMSHKKVTWICPKGHKYTMRVSNHVLGKGCPICAGNWRNYG